MTVMTDLAKSDELLLMFLLFFGLPLLKNKNSSSIRVYHRRVGFDAVTRNHDKI